MSEQKALTPIEQKQVEFYGDELTAVLGPDGTVFVPVRPICRLLGVSWDGQRRRILRDPVLSDEVQGVVVTTTPGGRQEMSCLPLDYISGFLFGINANRVKAELKERVILYQRECYRVLSEAFVEGRLMATPSFDALLQTDSPAVQAYKTFSALTKLARNQILLEARLTGRLDEHEQRLDQLESTLGDPGRHVTPDQASQISQAVKAVAMKMSEKSGRNEYGGVYGEMYRKFGITGYKLLPAGKFKEAMAWLSDWYQGLADSESPF